MKRSSDGNMGIDTIASDMREAYEDLEKAIRLRKRGIRLMIVGGCLMVAGVVGLILQNRQEEQ